MWPASDSKKDKLIAIDTTWLYVAPAPSAIARNSNSIQFLTQGIHDLVGIRPGLCTIPSTAAPSTVSYALYLAFLAWLALSVRVGKHSKEFSNK